MGKRFVDTRLYRERWYRLLSGAQKATWHFITGECDSIGVWPIDEEDLEFRVGEPVSLARFVSAVNADGKERVRRLGRDKLFVVDFVRFQYGTLSEDCKPHRPVIAKLKEGGLWEEYLSGPKGLDTLSEKEPKGSETLQEKEEEKEKEKDQEKETALEDFEAVYRDYPLKEGKLDGMIECSKQIKTQAELEELRTAVANYNAVRKRKLESGQFCPEPKHFSTFMRKGRWRECLEPDYGARGDPAPREVPLRRTGKPCRPLATEENGVLRVVSGKCGQHGSDEECEMEGRR